MGGTHSSSVGQRGNELTKTGGAFRIAMDDVSRRSGVLGGGCDCKGGYFGGESEADPAKDLREYESSLSAQTKEDIIRRLARALNRAGINVDAEGDLEVIVRKMTEQIPNPKNGRTFSDEARAQEKVCKAIATVLNDEFTPGATSANEKLIDTSLSAVEICRKVGEWTHSFATGVNMEFMSVHASLKNQLRNVDVLYGILNIIQGNLREKIESDGGIMLIRDTQPIIERYDRTFRELKHYQEIIKNILNVVLPPTAKTLELAMRDEFQTNALIKKLGVSNGVSPGGQTIASMVSELGSAANIAQKTHKALKLVGISINAYLNSSSFAELERLLDEKLENGEISSDQLVKFLQARDTLRIGYEEHTEPKFREALESMEKKGGAEAPKSTIARKVETKEMERKVLATDFTTRLARHYDEFLASVRAMAPKLGHEIPLSDKTDILNDAFAQLYPIADDTKRIEFSLIGMSMDAEARARKSRFVNTFRMVSSICGSIMELEMYREASPYLARLKSAIDSISKTIDYYSDVVTKKYGGMDMDEDEVKGGADDALIGSISNVARSGISLRETINEFAYYYYVAKVRSNLEQTSTELESYGDKYTELLGDAVANKIYSLAMKKEKILENIKLGEDVKASSLDKDNDKKKKLAPLVKKYVTEEFDTKIKFYNAVQAVDLYMKAFTVGIAKDPDAVRDIKRMLDSNKVIARWYTEDTGNYICRAFEAGATSTNAGTREELDDVPAFDDGTHYYNAVKGITNKVGVPQLGMPLQPTDDKKRTNAVQSRKFIDNAVDNFQALKNLVTAFARIGDKFGGRELHSQIFMSPIQIFKNLTDYLKRSALSMNYAEKSTAGAWVEPSPVQVNNEQLDTGADIIFDTVNGVPPWNMYFGSAGDGSGVADDKIGNYSEEDEYFVLIIKAMAAKIMTTIGVYEMLERTSPLYALTPIRFAVGGADGEMEVLSEASELYFRLPRLAEFYKSIFSEESKDSISFIPDMDGVFSKFIQLIFVKSSTPGDGDYSDSEMRVMVQEINVIYKHFHGKSPNNTNKLVLNSFVMEINRRYGVIKTADRDKFNELSKVTRSLTQNHYNLTNYAILPGEGETETEHRAPSDRYLMPTSKAANIVSPFEHRDGLDPKKRGLLTDFRKLLTAKFDTYKNKSSTSKTFGKESYSLLIKQSSLEMDRTPSQESKFKIATKLILNTSITGTDVNQSFMFHETVVVGLNMLSSIETMMREFKHSISAMNPVHIENAIMDSIYSNAVDNVANRIRLGEGKGDGSGGAANSRFTSGNLRRILNKKSKDNDKYFRYIVDNSTANYAGRNDFTIPMTPADVYQFLHLEEKQYVDDVTNAVNVAGAAALVDYAVGGAVSVALGVGAAAVAALISAADTAKTTTEAKYRLPNGALPSLLDSNLHLQTDPKSTGSEDGTHVGTIALRRFIRALRLGARMLTNYGLIMHDYVENVFDLMTTSKVSEIGPPLIEVRISKTNGMNIQFGFSHLKDMIDSLLADVKYFFEIFRPFLTPELIERFEDVKSSGSIFWIEQNLLDKFFLSTDMKSVEYKDTFDSITRDAGKVFTDLIRDTRVYCIPPPINPGTSLPSENANDAGINHANMTAHGNGAHRLQCIPVDEPSLATGAYETFGQTFSGLLFYNAIDANSGLTNLGRTRVQEHPLFELLRITPASGTTEIISDIQAFARTPSANKVSLPGTFTTHISVGGRYESYNLYNMSTGSGMTNYRSLMFSFNQVLARYLSSLIDISGGKRIYLNLVNAFANGAASRSVASPLEFTQPDLATDVKDNLTDVATNPNPFLIAATDLKVLFGFRGDPEPQSVLLQSLALILQRIIRDANPNTQIPRYLVTTLTDVPMYMKEAMRANLPTFIKYFTIISQKGDYLKQIIQRTDINLGRPSQLNIMPVPAADFTNAGGNDPHADAKIYAPGQLNGLLTGATLYRNYSNTLRLSRANPFIATKEEQLFKGLRLLDRKKVEHADMKIRFTEIIDSVVGGAMVLASSASETLKELGDMPMYLQTQENSTEQYTMRYGRPPIMPLSLAMYYMKDLDIDNRVDHYGKVIDNKMVPGHAMGTNDFKLMYGTRQLLMRGTPISFDQVPGIKQILDKYNVDAGNRKRIDDGRFLKFIQTAVGALRFLTESRNIKSVLSPSLRLFSAGSVIEASHRMPVDFDEVPAGAIDAAETTARDALSGGGGHELLDELKLATESVTLTLSAIVDDFARGATSTIIIAQAESPPLVNKLINKLDKVNKLAIVDYTNYKTLFDNNPIVATDALYLKLNKLVLFANALLSGADSFQNLINVVVEYKLACGGGAPIIPGALDSALNIANIRGYARTAHAAGVNAMTSAIVFGYQPTIEKTLHDNMTAKNGIMEYKKKTLTYKGTGSAVWTLDKSTSGANILEIVESSDQERSISTIIERTGGTALDARDRELEQIRNIIDMNIIPINVHALMRDIPLANLYNYSYTFEQMICSMYGESLTDISKADGSTVKNTKQMFLKLLMEPYMKVAVADYGSEIYDVGSAGLVHRIFRGDNNLGMGRPKFLSDQLFNKALFGSIYRSRADYDEGGPGTGIGHSRGQGGDLADILPKEFYGQYNSILDFNTRLKDSRTKLNTKINELIDLTPTLPTNFFGFIRRALTEHKDATDAASIITGTVMGIAVNYEMKSGEIIERILAAATLDVFEKLNMIRLHLVQLCNRVAVASAGGGGINGGAAAAGGGITPPPGMYALTTDPPLITLVVNNDAEYKAYLADAIVKAAASPLAGMDNAGAAVAAPAATAVWSLLDDKNNKDLIDEIVSLGISWVLINMAKSVDFKVINDIHTEIIKPNMGALKFPPNELASMIRRINQSKMMLEAEKNQTPGDHTLIDDKIAKLATIKTSTDDIGTMEALISPNICGALFNPFLPVPRWITNYFNSGVKEGLHSLASYVVEYRPINVSDIRLVTADELDIARRLEAEDWFATGDATTNEAKTCAALPVGDAGQPGLRAKYNVISGNSEISSDRLSIVFDILLAGSDHKNNGTLGHVLDQLATAYQSIANESKIRVRRPGGRNVYMQRSRTEDNILTYLQKPTNTDQPQLAVVEVKLTDAPTKLYLEAVGKKRFDTRFIRNLFFITNVVRVLRLKLNRELTHNRNVLVNSHMSVTPGVTEYDYDPFGTNEVYTSTTVYDANIERFNDNDMF